MTWRQAREVALRATLLAVLGLLYMQIAYYPRHAHL